MAGVYLRGWDATAEEWVKCIVNADGKLIINPTGFLENPPTENEANKAPTSEWAFDHEATVESHPDFYTDSDARGAINDILSVSGHVTGNFYLDYNWIIRWNAGYFMKHKDSDYRLYFEMQDTGPIVIFRGYSLTTGNEMGILQITDGTDIWDIIHQGTFQAELDDYLENPPVEDSANTAPTSEWAFDHNADTDKHHTKYTDAEAAMASYAEYMYITDGTYNALDVTGVHQIRLGTTSGDVILNGLANGVEGQIIFFVNTSGSNEVIINSLSGSAFANDRIVTYSGATETIPAAHYGSFYLIYNTLKWWVDKELL